MKALVLSGGAAKGAYQIGILKRWMGEQEQQYDIMTGVSVGAINVAGLGLFPKGSEKEAIKWLEDFWLRIDTKNVYKRWWPFGRLHALWKKSVYDSSPLEELVRTNIDVNKIRENNRNISVGACSLDTGELYYANQLDDKFAEWVIASASFPMFFKPVEIDGKLWSDGGLRNTAPLGQAIREGATDIDVIITDNPYNIKEWSSESKTAIPDQVVRSLQIMSSQILRADIELAGLKNDLVELEGKYKHIKIRLIMPDTDLIPDAFIFDHEQIKGMIEKGYNDSKNFVIYE